MEHQPLMQTPLQSHDMPPQRQRSSRRRPSSGSRAHHKVGGGASTSSQAAAAAENTNTGHIIQSRSTSQSHGLSKRARSRSRGRRNQQQQQQQGYQTNGGSGGRRTPQAQESISNSSDGRISKESNSNLGSSNNLMKRSSSSGTHDEYGRCIRHPNIELCYRDSATSLWRLLLKDCPLCSLDDSGSSSLRPETEANYKINDGGSSSQATGTRTLTTEEESSVKSWTLSDASNSDNESNCNNIRGRPSSTPEQQMKPRPPPPPRRPASNNTTSPQDNNAINRGNHYSRQHNEQQNSTFDPVQSLKELGRKLVMESEASAGAPFPSGDASIGNRSQASSVARPRRPPPPPPPGANSRQGLYQRENDDMVRRKSPLSTKEQLIQMRREQQKMRPPPRRGTTASAGTEESNEIILGEASDIISRMESLAEEESTSRHMRKPHTNQHQQMKPGDGDDAIARAAAEKSTRAQRLKEKAERKAARHRYREQKMQQQQNATARQEQGGSGQTFTLPMNDVMSPNRGRERGSEDILQAAAQIRARARRSASRSRERVKDASVFCGETPVDNNNHEQGDDHLSLSSEKKRSILNPHGLEGQSKPPVMERRSQSRENRRNQSGGRAGSRGRDRHMENVGLDSMLNQQTTAEGLLSRRREMRQKIAERQSNAQSRIEHRRQGPIEQAADDQLLLKEEVLDGWTRAENSDAGSISRRSRSRRLEGRSERRGRSRSAVRDSFSKMRSASLNAFRKKGDKGIDLEDETQSIDTGKRSTSSFKRLMSKGKPRSLSRGRTDLEDESQTRSTSSFKRLMSKGKPRSLSRGRIDLEDESQTRSTSSFKRLMSKGKPRSLSRGRIDLEDESQTRSTSSFKRLMSKGKPRSLSRGRHRQNTHEGEGYGDADGWGAKSETFAIDNDRRSFASNYEGGYVEMDARSAAKSENFTKQSSSRLGMLKKSLLKKKISETGGLVRSLSRGSFRDDDNHSFTYNERWENSRSVARSETLAMNRPTEAWENGPMRSSSSGKPRNTSHD